MIDTIRASAVPALDSLLKWIETQAVSGDAIMGKMIDLVKRNTENAVKAISPEAIKIALAYSEKSYETLGFKSLLAFIKQAYTLNPGMRICVLLTRGDIYVFDIMACDEKNEIAFSITCPWCHLIVANPETGLLEMFGDKAMLVLK
ncbi:MAG: hypothetical protein IKK82_13155 [Kiritimatiellae bacterium]|nr:hypothetical protein [Kiritimatiellia bacterium]